MKRFIAATMVAFVGFVGMAPSLAAPAKFAGSYKLHLTPDPSPNVFVSAGIDKCHNLKADSVDKRTVAVPAAGKFKVILDSPDPTGKGLTDWDMYLLDSKGVVLGKGTTGSSHEEVTVKLKGKTPVTIVVCNLNGAEDGTVTYTLK